MAKKTAVRVGYIRTSVIDTLYHCGSNGELNHHVAMKLISEHSIRTETPIDKSRRYYDDFIMRLIVMSIERCLNSKLDARLGDKETFGDIFDLPLGRIQERLLECHPQDMTLYELCDTYYVNGDLFVHDLIDVTANDQQLQKLCNSLMSKSDCNEYTLWRVEIASMEGSIFVFNEGDYRIMEWEHYFTNEGKYENPFGND